jgi:hypothetical protein
MEGGGEAFNSLERCYLQTVIYTKGTVQFKVAGLTELDKTQRNIGLRCAVLKVMICNL